MPKSGLAVSFIFLLCLGLDAPAQLSSSALRAKFGPPLTRETFHLPAGFDIVVDYGPNSQVCQAEVPALMPTNAAVRNSEMKQKMYDFLADLVPSSMRGKEVRRLSQWSGSAFMISVEYENLIVNESNGRQPFGNTITIRFKGDACRNVDPR
jgi:hypothetical protein